MKNGSVGHVGAMMACLAMGTPSLAAGGKPNVLFIAVDDLRPALHCYGVEQAITPNMDSLAASGRLFMNHYVQIPTCGASRASLFTGRLPRMASECKNSACVDLRRVKADLPITMPELFRRNGYRTVCIGKVSHSANGMDGGMPEFPDAWDELPTPEGLWVGHGPELLHAYAGGRMRGDDGYMPLWEFPEVEDNELPDGMLADMAVERLKAFAESGEPFFMGVGFYKPHLPFVAPKRYRDLYDGVAFPSPNGMKRGDTRKAGKSVEFYKYHAPFDPPVNGDALAEEDAQEVRRAYHACVTYSDAQVGRVLRTLEETGLAKNTIVVLWGDHGWHLGENNAWAKHTPLDKSLRSALIMRVPGQQAAGEVSDSLAASVDLYPTLLDLCGLEKQQTAWPLDGFSLCPILEDPRKAVRTDVLSFWFSTGITDGRYRLIVSGGGSCELYDHWSDPGELKNLAGNQPEVVDRLMVQLKRAYPQALISENGTK